MGVLLAFAVGYVVGARAGDEGYQEVADAVVAVRRSAEFQGLVRAVRAHAGHVLGELGRRLSPDAADPLTVQEVLDRVRSAARSAGVTSPAS